MRLALQRVCLSVKFIAMADQVSISRRDNGEICVLARSRGQPTCRAPKYRIPLLSSQRPVLIVKDVKKQKEFAGHVIFEVIPNLRSLMAYYFSDSAGHEYSLVVFNPAPNLIDNAIVQRTLEGMTDVILGILETRMDDAAPQDSRPRVDNEALREPIRPGPFDFEPLSSFLLETLTKKQKLLARNGVSYFALRQWRKSIKPYQIAAIAALKRSADRPIADLIAAEFEDAVRRVLGASFDYVVPIPGGSSGSEFSLSVEIATLLSSRLGIPLANILISGQVSKGASHPSKSANLKPYKLAREIQGNVLIVDDVVTSGRHIELASKALDKFCSHKVGLAWISD